MRWGRDWTGLAMLVAGSMLAESAAEPQANATAIERRQPAAAALVAFEKGNYAEAKASVATDLATCQRAPRFPVDCLDLLLSLSSVEIDTGDFSQAEAHAREALKLSQAELGEQHADTSSAYGNLSVSVGKQGRMREAEAFVRKDLEISRAIMGDKHPDTAISHNNLATNLDAQGRYAEAEPEHRRALAIWSVDPNAREYTAISHDNLAKNLDNQGRYSEGEAEYRIALAARRAIGILDHPGIATTLNNLATNFDARGRYVEAEALFREALRLREGKLGPNHHEIANALGNLASNLGLQGREEEAEPLVRRALAIRLAKFGPHHSEVGRTLSNLAVGIERQGRRDEAVPMLREARSILIAALGRDHPDTLTVAVRLAIALAREGERREPEALLRDAAQRGKKLGAANPDYAEYRIELARFFVNHGQAPAGRALLEAAIPVLAASIGDDHPEVILARATLAEALRRSDRRVEANALFASASDAAVQRFVLARGNNIAERRAIGAFAPVFKGRIDMAWASSHDDRSRSTNDGCDQPCADAFVAAQWAINSSAGYAIDRVAARTAQGSGPIARLEREREALALTRDAEDRRYQVTGDDPVARAALLASRADKASRIDAIDREIAAIDPAYADLARPRAAGVAAIQAALRPDEAMLVTVSTAEAGYIWAITATQVRWARRPELNAPALDRTVTRLRRGLAADGAQGRGQTGRKAAITFDHATAATLYASLVAPVETLIAGKRVLLTATTGALGSLPLTLLPTGTDASAPWLIDRIALATLPSPASLTRMRCAGCGAAPATSPRATIIAGLGAPEIAPAPAIAMNPMRDRLGRLPPLPFARRELDEIGARYPGRATIVTGAAATEARVRSDPALTTARFIVFATHGIRTGDGGRPGEPALVFSPPDSLLREDNDGLLTISEAAQMQVSADLVALSACDTAAPDGSFDGDDLSGFAHAFLSAGARALIVSHWAVNDEATSRLMIDTFDTLGRAEAANRAIALQGAMRGLRDDPSGRWAHPRYWAAFALVGAPD